MYLRIKVKKLLVAILLGFFAGSKWNGQYLANGTIVKSDGSQLAYHITDLASLENYYMKISVLILHLLLVIDMVH